MKSYKIDPMHSEISFKVRHLLISNVSGKFKEFDGSLQKDGDDFTDVAVKFSAKISSIDTGNAQRDQHLLTSDFFEAERFPEITFVSTKSEKDGDSYKVFGDLTIKGITKNIALEVEYNGESVDGYGQTKIGFEGSGKINRKDFGLTMSMVTETGTVVIGDEVKLNFEAQFIQQ